MESGGSSGTSHIYTNLVSGKKGLVMGVVNRNSIAWGVAKALKDNGAQVVISYQNEGLAKRVIPLAQELGAVSTVVCDVSKEIEVSEMFDKLKILWPDGLDFVVHSIAYADKNELRGAYVNTTQDNFLHTMNISCYSFTCVARYAARIMQECHKATGGSLLTFTYEGARRVVPNYNVMGVAKAALEASVLYLARDLGSSNIRVNAISAGPVRTLSGSAIGNARFVYNWVNCNAPIKGEIRNCHVGQAALYFLSDLSSRVTGEIMHVDGGYHIVAVPDPEVSDNNR